MEKSTYLAPETEVVVVRFQEGVLTMSGGAKTQGYSQKAVFDDDDWDID